MGKLWSSQNKGKKKSNPVLKGKKIIREPGEKIGPGYLGIPNSLGSLGCAARPSWDWNSSRGHAQKYEEREQICPYQPSNDVEKGSEGLGTNNSWVRVYYLGEPRKKNHEGKWMGIFQPSRKELAHLRKMIKGKNVGLKKWNLEALEKERTKVNLLRSL